MEDTKSEEDKVVASEIKSLMPERGYTSFSIYSVPNADFVEFKELARRHTGTNKFADMLRILMDGFYWKQQLGVQAQVLNELVLRVQALERQDKEPVKVEKKGLGTFGGN